MQATKHQYLYFVITSKTIVLPVHHIYHWLLLWMIFKDFWGACPWNTLKRFCTFGTPKILPWTSHFYLIVSVFIYIILRGQVTKNISLERWEYSYIKNKQLESEQQTCKSGQYIFITTFCVWNVKLYVWVAYLSWATIDPRSHYKSRHPLGKG